MIRDNDQEWTEEVTESLSLHVPFEEVASLQLFLTFLTLSPGNHDDGASQS